MGLIITTSGIFAMLLVAVIVLHEIRDELRKMNERSK